MPAPEVTVLPQERPQPPTSAMPLEGAHHWLSAHEVDGLQPGLAVFVERVAYLDASVHACSDSTNEVGGVLVGRWGVDPSGQAFIVVEVSLRARFTEQGSAFLTFTRESLVDIHKTIDEQFPDRQIVGWYHSHPHIGIFLSHYDTWLHQHFFPEPWQVALVIEPHSYTGGFFIRQADGELAANRYFGFYELGGEDGRSVVRWRNLTRVTDDIDEGGN